MKKTGLLLLLSLVLSFNTWSQVRIALIGGPQSSSIIEKTSVQGWDTDAKPFFQNRSGFHLGFLLSVPLNQQQTVFFQPGFMYSTKGNKYYKRNDTTVYKAVDSVYFSNNFFTSYIEVPLNLAYRFKLSKKAGFIVSAGPYVSFFYNGEQTTSARTFKRNLNASPDYDLEGSVKVVNEEKRMETGKGVDKAQSVDLGYNFRAGIDIGSVYVSGFYSQGLTNAYQRSYDATTNNKVIGASLGIWLNKLPEPVAKDRDGDGVPDKSDKCPDVPGLEKYLGCPATDTDKDGVPDEADKCPQVAGLAKYNGCPIPDTDGDGINDELDKCPEVAGVAKYNGCPVPDKDGDGINDENDKCPEVAGVAKYNGCPVPDTDGDGVDDEHDKCPAEKGTAANNGCPEVKQEVIEKINFAAKNIFFKSGSDIITKESFVGLDEVVSILSKDNSLQVQIDGHTDNTGSAAANLALSQKRANAVKNYLVSKGIDAARLGATGLGQTRPVADNATKAGQKANRRVEMTVVQK